MGHRQVEFSSLWWQHWSGVNWFRSVVAPSGDAIGRQMIAKAHFVRLLTWVLCVCEIVWGALMFEIVESVSILVRKYQPG